MGTNARESNSTLLWGLFVLFLLFPIATRCQTNGTTTFPSQTTSPNRTGPLIVGFIYVSNPQDFGWTYQGYTAQAALEDFYGKAKVKALFAYDVTVTSYKPIVVDMIAQGAELIITVSATLEAVQVALSKEYPNTKFVAASGTTRSSNIATTVHNAFQTFYMGGVMAAHLSTTKKAGFLAGNWLTSTIKCANAFLMGARTVVPDFQVYVIRVPTTLDALRNRKGVETLIKERDCDVFTGITVTQAIVSTAVNNQKYCFGYPSDGRLLFGELVYSGCQMEWYTTYKFFVDQVLNNQWQANFTLSYGLKEKGNALSHLSSRVEAHVEESVKNWTDAISSGAYCMFNRGVSEFAKAYNASSFDKNGCLLESLVRTTTVVMDGVNNLGLMSDDQVFEKIYVRWDSTSGIALSTVVVFFNTLMLVCLGLVILFKGTMIIVATNFYFCLAVLTGALFGYSGLFFWIGEPDDNICAARIWFLALSFTFIFGAIAGKTYKMWRIWSNPNIAEDGRSSFTLNLFLVSFSMVMILLLSLITGLHGYYSGSTTDTSLEYNQYYVTCTLSNSGVIVLSLILAVCGVITFLASVLAFLSRNVHKKFNETSSIVLSIYNILIAEAVVVLLFLNTKSSDPQNHLIFISCGTFIAITCPILYMFVPKLYVLVKDYSVSKASSSNSFSKNSLPN